MKPIQPFLAFDYKGNYHKKNLVHKNNQSAKTVLGEIPYYKDTELKINYSICVGIIFEHNFEQ